MNHQTLHLYQFFLREYITRGPFICVCLILFMSIYLTNYLAIDLSTVQDEREREREGEREKEREGEREVILLFLCVC